MIVNNKKQQEQKQKIFRRVKGITRIETFRSETHSKMLTPVQRHRLGQLTAFCRVKSHAGCVTNLSKMLGRVDDDHQSHRPNHARLTWKYITTSRRTMTIQVTTDTTSMGAIHQSTLSPATSTIPLKIPAHMHPVSGLPRSNGSEDSAVLDWKE
eukprot:s1047_g19.t1